MKHTFKTQGVCSALIEFELTDGLLHNVVFYGGCDGNLKAISKLTEGKNAAETAEILKGNRCGYKGTSCADQLSKAITQALKEEGVN